MPEGNQQSEETGKNTSEQQGWPQEPFLLLLRDDWVYTTGDILKHWLADPGLSDDDKQAVIDRKSSIQSYLSRYIAVRENAIRKGVKDNEVSQEELGRIFSPVDTQPYLRTKSNQKLYLGAQLKWVAGRYLGRPDTLSTQETLALMTASEDQYQRFDVTKLGKTEAQVGNQETQAATLPATEQAASPVATKQNDDMVNQDPQKGMGLRSLMQHFSFRLSPIKMVTAGMMVFLVGLSFGALLWDHAKGQRLQEFEKNWKADGVQALDDIADVTSGKVFAPDQLYLALWKRAYDPKQTIEGMLPLYDALSDVSDEVWKARASHALGVAYLNRGMIQKALTYFEDAEEFLSGSDLDSDVRKVHLSKARCYFHLKDIDAMLRETEQAESSAVSSSQSRIHYFKALYWFMKGDKASAIGHAKESLQISLSEGAKGQSGYYYATLGLICIADGQLNEAYRHLRLAQEVAAQTNDKALMFQLQGYEMLWAEHMNLPTVAPEGLLGAGLFEETLILRRSFIELAREQIPK